VVKYKSVWNRGLHSGQSLVEFALTLPLLILFIVGIFDLGWAIYAKNTIADAAREGARTGIVLSKTDADIRARVRAASQGLDLSDDSQIIIGARAHFQSFSVTVNYSYTPLTTLIVGGVSVPLSSTATMVVE
jgi:Flp pilus assembly protein TadG